MKISARFKDFEVRAIGLMIRMLVPEKNPKLYGPWISSRTQQHAIFEFKSQGNKKRYIEKNK